MSELQTTGASRPVHYVAYGSNMLTRRLQRRVPGAEALGPVVLRGYRLCTNKRSVDRSSKCNLVEDPQQEARGVLFALPQEQVANLDRAEGLGRGYVRQTISCLLHGAPHEAFVYLAAPAYVCDGVLPYAWYMDFARYGAREHGLPADYVQRLDDWQTLRDPDTERRAINEHILYGD